MEIKKEFNEKQLKADILKKALPNTLTLNLMMPDEKQSKLSAEIYSRTIDNIRKQFSAHITEYLFRSECFEFNDEEIGLKVKMECFVFSREDMDNFLDGIISVIAQHNSAIGPVKGNEK